MKSTVKIFFILLLIGVASSCQKEGNVCYRFEIYNGTEKPMTMNLSSWGNYIMFINGIYNSEYKFHPTEAIESHSSLIFDEIVEDNPDPYAIPSSLTLPWEYIKSIECDGVEIPKEYYSNINNWDFGVAHQINGIFSKFTLTITPELIKQFNQTE
ncbi:hypothetical protein ACOMSG_07225 [Macellibacteroides fermentans]|jgi:hypothetical protein|uniref:hypothetical protein n=1 Tax=Macellibacteroides fermentans TaxID=879969 RepID=UPI003B94C80C